MDTVLDLKSKWNSLRIQELKRKNQRAGWGLGEIRGENRVSYKNILLEYISNSKLDQISVHKSCRKRFIDLRKIQSVSDEKEPPTKRTRASAVYSWWQTNCFICGVICDPKHDETRQASTISLKDNGSSRKDGLGWWEAGDGLKVSDLSYHIISGRCYSRNLSYRVHPWESRWDGGDFIQIATSQRYPSGDGNHLYRCKSPC